MSDRQRQILILETQERLDNLGRGLTVMLYPLEAANLLMGCSVNSLVSTVGTEKAVEHLRKFVDAVEAESVQWCVNESYSRWDGQTVDWPCKTGAR